MCFISCPKYYTQTHNNYKKTMSKETKTKRFQVFHASYQDTFPFNFSHFKVTFVTSTNKEHHVVRPFSQL